MAISVIIRVRLFMVEAGHGDSQFVTVFGKFEIGKKWEKFSESIEKKN